MDPEVAKRVAIVRVEELYPWPAEELRRIVERHPNLSRVLWVQEEPRNMGGWSFVNERIQDEFPPGVSLDYVGRAASSSPATGSMRAHVMEQRKLVSDAFFGLEDCDLDPWAGLRSED